jgi:hypothetical protein
MGMEKEIISSEIKKDGFSTASKSKRLGEIEDQTKKNSQLLTDALQTSNEETQKAAEECAGNDNISEDLDSNGTGEDSGVSASSGDATLSQALGSQALGSQSLSASPPHLDVRA